MFCTKCGKEIPDNSTFCPFCGQQFQAQPQAQVPVAAPVPQAPVAQPVNQAQYAQPQVAPAQSSSSITVDYDIGAFVSDLPKDPVEACTSRAIPKHWLLGLTFPVLYLILQIIYNAIDIEYKKGTFITINLLTDAFTIAATMGLLVLFTSVFGTKKLDYVSSVSLVGLGYFLYPVMYLIQFICQKIWKGMDYKGFAFDSLFPAVALLFLLIVVYNYYLNNIQANGNKKKAFYFVAIWYASKIFLNCFFYWLCTEILL